MPPAELTRRTPRHAAVQTAAAVPVAGVSAHPVDATSLAAGPRRRLGQVLLDEELITPAQLEHALAEQQNHAGTGRLRLGQVVADLGYATEREVAQALATHLGMESVDLSKVALDADVVRRLPRNVAERSQVLIMD
ncbi:MAG: hypothetical protein ACRC0L_01910, partial [Angustibacter sp.]